MEADHLLLVDGSEHIDIEGGDITGISEGTSYVKGVKGNSECLFMVKVTDLPDNEENMLIGFEISRIFDPDFKDVSNIDFSGMPVYEHICSGMVDLGYIVSCKMEFSKDELPSLPEIRMFDEKGTEYYAHNFNGKTYERSAVNILNTEYKGKTLCFDIYIPPHTKFYSVLDQVNIHSVQEAEELIICLDLDTRIEIKDRNNSYPIITKEIESDLLQVFWYNLRRNCYDDLNYERGR
jgi:hypothetical protein